MENLSSLILEKLIVSKVKGFTFIEVLIVLQIVLIMTYFYLPYAKQELQQSEVILEQMKVVLENVRFDSIINYETNEIQFNNHAMFWKGHILLENKQLMFKDNYQIYFNGYGHVRKAATIYFELKKQDYKLVFNLGQGAFYIEKT